MSQPGAQPTRTQRAGLSALGLGYSPVAPGTLTSAVITLLLYGLATSSPIVLAAGALALVFLGSLLTVLHGGAARAPDGGKDPGWVVSDEVAGQALACLGVLPAFDALAVAGRLPAALLGAFLLFRVLDIAKPWPIGRLECVPGGWGVLLDDVAAGLLAALALALLSLLAT